MVRRLGPWKDQAECLDADTRMFFAHPSQEDDRAAAKAICGRCDVVEECLAYAIETDQRYGIWGGLDERERRRELARVRKAARKAARRTAP